MNLRGRIFFWGLWLKPRKTPNTFYLILPIHKMLGCSNKKYENFYFIRRRLCYLWAERSFKTIYLLLKNLSHHKQVYGQCRLGYQHISTCFEGKSILHTEQDLHLLLLGNWSCSTYFYHHTPEQNPDMLLPLSLLLLYTSIDPLNNSSLHKGYFPHPNHLHSYDTSDLSEMKNT